MTDTWRKSRRSEGSNCVEVAQGILVRHTKDRAGVVLTFTPAAWKKFTNSLKGDQ